MQLIRRIVIDMELENDPSENSRRSSRDLSRHPLTTLVVGFVLTVVGGTFLSNYYSEKQAEAERVITEQKAYVDASTDAIQDFSNLLYERHTWSMMLASSIRRKAPIDEIKARKSEYDRVFIKWNTTYQSNLLTIRKVMKAPRFSSFEAYVDGSLSEMLRKIDDCLTEVYDVRLETNSAELALEKYRECGAGKRLAPARNCSYEITSGLFELVNSPKRDKELIADVNQRINASCKHDT